MKWEYLQVYVNDEGIFVAFDGNSICDGDKSLIVLLNKLGKDRWEYCNQASNGREDYPYHLLKRECRVKGLAYWDTGTWRAIQDD